MLIDIGLMLLMSPVGALKPIFRISSSVSLFCIRHKTPKGRSPSPLLAASTIIPLRFIISIVSDIHIGIT